MLDMQWWTTTTRLLKRIKYGTDNPNTWQGYKQQELSFTAIANAKQYNHSERHIAVFLFLFRTKRTKTLFANFDDGFKH